MQGFLKFFLYIFIYYVYLLASHSDTKDQYIKMGKIYMTFKFNHVFFLFSTKLMASFLSSCESISVELYTLVGFVKVKNIFLFNLLYSNKSVSFA